MPIVVVPDLAAYVEASSGWVVLAVRGGDGDTVERGLRLAARRVFWLAHPDEPSGPFPNYADVRTGSHGAELVLDVHDAEAYPGIADQIIGIVVACLAEAGVADATLVAVHADEPAADGNEAGSEDPAFQAEWKAAAESRAAGARDFLAGFPWPPGARAVQITDVGPAGTTVQGNCDGPVDAVLSHLEAALELGGYTVIFSAQAADRGRARPAPPVPSRSVRPRRQGCSARWRFLTALSRSGSNSAQELRRMSPRRSAERCP
jgi:hypothetical protein